MKGNRQHSAGPWRRMLLALAALAVLAGGQASAQSAADPEAAWRKALPRIEQAERESLAAVDDAITDVGRHFDTAAPNIRPWVVDLLGIWNKVEFAVGGVQKLVNGAAGLIDSMFQANLGQPAGADRFEAMARRTFAEKVLDPAGVRRAIESAAENFNARLDVIQSKLYVDLDADIEEVGGKPVQSTPLRLSDAVLSHIDAAMSDAVADATADFILAAGKEAVGWALGNVATTALMAGGAAAGQHAVHTGDPLTDLGGLAVGAGLGFVIGVGLDAIQDFVGHDPVGQLAAKIGKRLADARDALIKGDENTTHSYAAFVFHGLMNPDPEARIACDKAADTIARRKTLGLRGVLMAGHYRRMMGQRTAIWRSIHGKYSDVPAEIFIDMKTLQPAEALMKTARAWYEPKEASDR